MDPVPDSFRSLTARSRRVLRQLLTAGANRLEILRVEVQEEQEILVRTIFLACGAAAFGMLAGITLTGLLVFLFYERAPVSVMLILSLLYILAALLLLRRIAGLLRSRQRFSATSGQLRKDRAGLESLFQ